MSISYAAVSIINYIVRVSVKKIETTEMVYGIIVVK